MKAVADVDAMIVRSDIVDPEVSRTAEKLKLVSARRRLRQHRLRQGQGEGRGRDEHAGPERQRRRRAAVGLMIYMARDKFSGKTGFELRGKRLGIHAIGATGRGLARAAKGFDMKVRAFDPFVSEKDMHDLGAEPVKSAADLYAQSDFVSLHMPANKETKKSIGKALMTAMPKGAMLVNTARAELINEEELLQVLEERKDLRYASDVEPTAPTAAVIKEKFADRVYWTPKKMGAQTEEANVNAGLAAARQIVGFFERGERKFIVNG